MTTMHLVVFLLLMSPWFISSERTQRNELVEAEFSQTDTELYERNEFVLDVNGDAQTILNKLYQFVEDRREVNNQHTIADLSTKQLKNQVQSSTNFSDQYNKISSFTQFKKKYNNEVLIRYNNRLKRKCNRKKMNEIDKRICFSYRKLRKHTLPRWFIQFVSLNDEEIERPPSYNKISRKDNSTASETKTSRYSVRNNFELKKRCCRYHFKFYFKYFPVLETYVLELLNSIEEMFILSFILDVGFIMSCSALICIFISMVISRKLREERGNVILLHFCFSIFVQIVLHVLICDFRLNAFSAELASNSFQYFTLVEFAWTSVIAFIQYRRYVTVLSSDPDTSVWKLSLIVYVSSAVPIIARVIWDHDHSKLMTYLTFSIPQFITLVINLVILISITKNVMCTKVWFVHQKRSISMEVKVIFMLFLILDLGWIVAMLTLLTSNITLAYIFIFSQSLQGFLLFFIFILMNRQNRRILKNIWTIKTEGIEQSCCKKTSIMGKLPPLV